MENRVQFSNAWSEKDGDAVPSETMSLEDAQRFIADHPETESVILHRTAGAEPSIWSALPSDGG
jgi:hypothetical protein